MADDTHIVIEKSPDYSLPLVARDIRTGKETPFDWHHNSLLEPATVLPGVRLSLWPQPPDTHALYLHVTAGKRELPPLLLGGSLLSHDTRAVLAPDQSSAMWIQNGDLYACTFAVVPATDADKAAAR